jgi:hypothetical protein
MELPRQFKTWADRRTRTCRLKYKEQFCYASSATSTTSTTAQNIPIRYQTDGVSG